jgi:hypothetical protein
LRILISQTENAYTGVKNTKKQHRESKKDKSAVRTNGNAPLRGLRAARPHTTHQPWHPCGLRLRVARGCALRPAPHSHAGAAPAHTPHHRDLNILNKLLSQKKL